MDLVKCESYYIKIREMYVLLAGLELPCIYGIAADNAAIPEKQEMNRILIELYQKQIIDWEEESIAIKQPYTDMFSVISASIHCIVFKGSGEGNLPVHCCYLSGEAVVMTEKSQREEGMLCVSYMSYEEWLAYIEECLETEREKLEQDLKLILEIRNSRTGNEYAKLTIKEQGVQMVVIEQYPQGKKQYLYDKDMLAKLLQNYLKV